MFEVLVGSRAERRVRPMRGVAVAAFHSALILGAIQVTTRSPAPIPAPEVDTTRFLVEPVPAPSAPVVSSGVATITAAPAVIFPEPPSTMPLSIPSIRLGPALDPERLRAAIGPRSPGQVGANPVSAEWVLDAALVDEPARVIRQPAPRYPPVLRHAGVEGRVLMEFIIDTTGHVEQGSLRIVESLHPGFEAAAEETLTQSVFAPARMGGRVVRQRARQVIAFRILPE